MIADKKDKEAKKDETKSPIDVIEDYWKEKRLSYRSRRRKWVKHLTVAFK